MIKPVNAPKVVLVFGQTGQVATALSQQYQRLPNSRWHFLGRQNADLRDSKAVEEVVQRFSPSIVLNAAAYTGVDAAEDNENTAMAVNAAAPAAMARACKALDIPLVHLSTDYVFDGSKTEGAYDEADQPAPISAYGRSKLAGEEGIRAVLDKRVIIRTAWVYSPWGKNFVRTMLHAAGTRDRLSVVSDQWGCPTSAWDIADAMITVSNELLKGRKDAFGTYHYAGLGATTWHGFAEEIFRLSAKRGGKLPVVEAIPSSDYPTPAARPANSRLNSHRIAAAYGVPARPWRESLAQCVDVLMPVHARQPAQ